MTGGDDKVTNQGRLTRIRICERIDSIPVDLELIEPGDDAPRSLEPGRGNGMIGVDGAGGADNLLRLGTYGDGPRRSGLENARGAGPEEIGEGVRIVG